MMGYDHRCSMSKGLGNVSVQEDRDGASWARICSRFCATRVSKASDGDVPIYRTSLRPRIQHVRFAHCDHFVLSCIGNLCKKGVSHLRAESAHRIIFVPLNREASQGPRQRSTNDTDPRCRQERTLVSRVVGSIAARGMSGSRSQWQCFVVGDACTHAPGLGIKAFLTTVATRRGSSRPSQTRMTNSYEEQDIGEDHDSRVASGGASDEAGEAMMNVQVRNRSISLKMADAKVQ